MKIKKWHLFFVIILLFVVSFFIVNLKFDKFYRLNYINNDNRVLIETYLDDDEQEYLVENQIPIIDFIDLIDIEEFDLYNYQYYKLIKNSNRYNDKHELVRLGNNLSTRLNYLFDDPVNKAIILLENNLENDFLNNNNFKFGNISMYISLKTLYDKNDYSYIDDLDLYINELQSQGLKDNIEETIDMLCKSYTKESLFHLFNQTYDQKISIVYNPYELTTIVNDYNYIGQYTPKDLLLTQNLPRKNYSMYLQKDAYSALVNLYQDLSKEHKSFVLLEAFKSYDSLLKDNKAGFDEAQLGLTVCISQKDLAYNHFETSKMCEWLEKNAYKYGFILRYPKNKASITNHSYDPHIYRYVGIPLAKSLYLSDLTLEEYKSDSSKTNLIQ